MDAPPLAYVAVVVDDVAAVADTFERMLGLPRTEVASPDGGALTLVAIGESAVALLPHDHPFLGGTSRSGVHHIAIADEDPEARAEVCGIRYAPPQPGLAGGVQLALERADTCGVATRLCHPFELSVGRSPYVERIDHIGVASADNRAAGAVFSDRLGCPVESTQTDFEIVQPIESFTSDKYGVRHHSRAPEPVGGLRVSFLSVGDCELEMLQPMTLGDAPVADSEGPARNAPGNTRGDKGAIARYIERRGAGAHHLALKSPDIDATLSHLQTAGLRMIDSVGRPGSRAARIGFIHPASLGGLLLHFVEREDL